MVKKLIKDLVMQSTELEADFKELLLSQESFVFYGCGNQGMICEDLLANRLGYELSGFLVSDSQPAVVKWPTTQKVYELSASPFDKSDTWILLTVGYQTACVISDHLKSIGYKHVCVVKDWEQANEALREISLRAALSGFDYTLEPGKDFAVNGFRFPDPYQNATVRSMFYRECENILGQKIFGGGYQQIIDSPYENGFVRMKPGDLVMDCGANIGLFSALAAWTGCDVYAFEPAAHIADITRQVYAGQGTVTVVPKALVEKEGTVMFHQAGEQNHYKGDSSRVGNFVEGKDTVEDFVNLKVPCTTIDAVVKEYGLAHVDFVKADIEGAERLMLQGAGDTLKRFAPKLSICTYHLPDDREVLTKIILDANPAYHIDYSWDKLYAYVP